MTLAKSLASMAAGATLGTLGAAYLGPASSLAVGAMVLILYGDWYLS